MKKYIIICVITALIIAGSLISYFFLFNKDDSENSVPNKFKEEYPLVHEDNVFVYSDIETAINILEGGTGVIYIGFPECPWCQAYVPYLNEVANDIGLDKIYYVNIKEDRSINSEMYTTLVSYLTDYLKLDDNGNPRVYVPTVISVVNGEVTGFNDETSLDLKGFTDPELYWSDEAVKNLKTDLISLINPVYLSSCTPCNG